MTTRTRSKKPVPVFTIGLGTSRHGDWFIVADEDKHRLHEPDLKPLWRRARGKDEDFIESPSALSPWPDDMQAALARLKYDYEN